MTGFSLGTRDRSVSAGSGTRLAGAAGSAGQQLVVIRHAAAVQARFEQVHPFSDGNDRLGRLLLHGMLLRLNLPPAIVRPDRKRRYNAALNEAQRGGGTARLEGVVCDGILEGFRILGGRVRRFRRLEDGATFAEIADCVNVWASSPDRPRN